MKHLEDNRFGGNNGIRGEINHVRIIRSILIYVLIFSNISVFNDGKVYFLLSKLKVLCQSEGTAANRMPYKLLRPQGPQGKHLSPCR